MPNDIMEINILIAIDCISEVQNLQDCDYLINTRLIQSDQNDTENLSIELNGLNLDNIGEKTVMNLEGGVWNEELSLEENIILREKKKNFKKGQQNLRNRQEVTNNLERNLSWCREQRN